MTARAAVLVALALTALTAASAAAHSRDHPACDSNPVQILLEASADRNATRGVDQTPLEVAESCSNPSERDDIVSMLREAGATGP